MTSPYDELKKLEEEIKECRRCELHKFIKNKVPGEGKIDFGIMFIGEAPGREEDRQGRPFVGAGGKLLTKMIEDILEIKREDVYITNVLKCRPPNNRDPKPEEIEACRPFLERQLEIIKPKLIVCLGRFSAKWIFDYFGLKFTRITEVRGKIFKVNKWGHDTYIVPTFHPAAVLYHAKWKPLFEEDFKKIRDIVDQILGRKREGESKNKQKTLLDFFSS